MTKIELVSAVAEKAGLSKKDSEKVVAAVFSSITEGLQNGEKFSLVGFGTFEVKERAARPGVNPRTKEPITIAASKSVVFKPGKALKDAVKYSRFLSFLGARYILPVPLFYGKAGFFMRLDKYLKVSRIIKRRTVANEACDAQRVLVNGKAARASYEVKLGDKIQIELGQRPLTIQVTGLSEVTTKENASQNYTIIEG